MDLVKRIRQNVYALLPLLSSNVRNNYLHLVILGFVLLIIFQLLYSYKSYLNFKFHIKEGRFFLRHGVFKFTETDIPFDRIQNININQNLIQQMLNVVGFEIETAGQGSAEIKIKALSREDAAALKQILLENKAEEVETESDVSEQKKLSSAKVSSEKVFKLDPGRLLKVGLSANYLKGFGLVFVFIMTLFQYVEDIFSNFFNINVSDAYADKVNPGLGFFTALFVLIILASFLVTVVNTIIRYFELKITKIKNDFEVEYGLFKRVNQVIKKSKTQVFELETNPLKDMFKIKSVFISQASSEELNDKKKVGLVGLSIDEVEILFKSLFDLDYNQDFIISRSSMKLMFRLVSSYLLICTAIGIGMFYWMGKIVVVIIPLLIAVLLVFVAFKKVKKSYVGVNENLVFIHSGSIHTNKKYIATHKVQSLALKRNVFQQRNQHADLIVYTASGSERINYLKLDDALKIINFLNYKVESSDLGWI